MDANEVASHVGVSPRWIEMWRRARLLMARRVGEGRYQYDAAEVRVGRVVHQLMQLSVPAHLVDTASVLVRGLPPDVEGRIVVHRDGLVRLDGDIGEAAWVVALDPVPELAAAAV